MRTKIFSVGAALFLLAGIIYLLTTGDNNKPDPVESPTDPISISQLSEAVTGEVMANDEPPDSAPFQSQPRQPDAVVPQPSARPKQKRTERIVVINNKEYPLRTYKPLLTPNDPQAAQWWVTNTKLNQAWDTPAGNNETVLAIIDTGFALGHEEFAGRWYTNTGEAGPAVSEQPSARNCTDRGLALNANCNLIDDNMDRIVDNEFGATSYQNPSRLNCSAQAKSLTRDCNRIDDDNNGYIDDKSGWDFINFDNSAQAGELNPNGTGTTHGTLVAGVAAATGNNSKGIAGVDWYTKILPIQAIDDDSYGDTLSVGRAILYAAEQGADVISLSLGSDLPDDYVQEVVQAAIKSGSVVVAASGNDGCDCMAYPASYPEVVGVGALNNSGLPASFSSWGQGLDILAPGTGLTSATWQPGNQTTVYQSGINGTSFATPLVSGMLTRLLSHQPSAVPLQLIASLTENTNRMSLPATTPHDTKLGYGSMDSSKATLRMVTARNSEQLYVFKPVNKGDSALFGPSEDIGQYEVHECEAGVVGSTRIYELIKNSSKLFSISGSEVDKARKSGYTSISFSHSCVQQPHDTANRIREIDLFSEFRNIQYRPLL